MVQRRNLGRAALLLLYVLEAGVLAPLHLLVEAHPPPPALAIASRCGGEAPCDHPGHHHDADRHSHQCPACAPGSRVAVLAAGPHVLVPLVPVLALCVHAARGSGAEHAAAYVPRGPPLLPA